MENRFENRAPAVTAVAKHHAVGLRRSEEEEVIEVVVVVEAEAEGVGNEMQHSTRYCNDV